MWSVKRGGRCPYCESGALNPVKKELVFKYKGRTKTLQNQKVYVCNVCKEETQTEADFNKTEKILSDFIRDIDGLLSCSRLKAIREKLGLNKSQMAEVLSVNSKTIGRYESGKLKQCNQVDKLYRLLERDPRSVCVVRKNDHQEGFLKIPVEAFEEDNAYIPRQNPDYIFNPITNTYEKCKEAVYG